MNLFCRLALLLALFGTLLCAESGCHFMNFFPKPPSDIVEEPFTPEPGKHFYRVPPYVFLADSEIDPKLPIFKELANLRDQIALELQLPTTQKLIRVYLFENRTKYEQYMASKHPTLPKRRAYFVAMPKPLGGSDDLMVYTFWGERIQQDLRHELTHALLHSVLLDVPQWLDEGLAEYFENPQGWSGINYKHLDALQRGAKTFQPNMNRLESLREVDDMTMADYRESWAWVHYMLRGNPKAKEVVKGYLQELRTNSKPGPLRPRLAAVVPDLNAALLQHLRKLEATAPPRIAAN